MKTWFAGHMIVSWYWYTFMIHCRILLTPDTNNMNDKYFRTAKEFVDERPADDLEIEILIRLQNAEKENALLRVENKKLIVALFSAENEVLELKALQEKAASKGR